jgi:hypothetical protein
VSLWSRLKKREAAAEAKVVVDLEKIKPLTIMRTGTGYYVLQRDGKDYLSEADDIDTCDYVMYHDSLVKAYLNGLTEVKRIRAEERRREIEEKSLERFPLTEKDFRPHNLT